MPPPRALSLGAKHYGQERVLLLSLLSETGRAPSPLVRISIGLQNTASQATHVANVIHQIVNRL